VIGVPTAGTSHNATLILQQIFVRKSPSPLAIDHSNGRSATPRKGPREEGIDACWSGAEIPLPISEIGCRGWRVCRIRLHVIDTLLQGPSSRRWRFACGFDIGGLDQVVMPQFFGKLVELVLRGLHAVEAGQVRKRLSFSFRERTGRASSGHGFKLGLEAILAQSEQWAQDSTTRAEN
jgi:hypothetical protein